jgi:hypothetical protein
MLPWQTDQPRYFIVSRTWTSTTSSIAVADFLGRRAVGIDLNTKFVRDFDSKGFDKLVEITRVELGDKDSKTTRARLAPLIIRLRALKSPRTLFSQLSRPDRLGNDARQTVAACVLTAGKKAANSKSRIALLGRASLHVLVRHGTDIERVRQHAAKALAVPPLSKFGLEFDVEVVPERQWKDPTFFRGISGKRWYVYVKGNFHAFSRTTSRDRLSQVVQALADSDKSRFPPIVSTLKADVRSALID